MRACPEGAGERQLHVCSRAYYRGRGARACRDLCARTIVTILCSSPLSCSKRSGAAARIALSNLRLSVAGTPYLGVGGPEGREAGKRQARMLCGARQRTY